MNRHQDNRMTNDYVIEKEIQESPCEHPMCEHFHRQYMQRGINDVWFHETKTTWWIVIDTATGEQAFNASTRTECRQFVDGARLDKARKAVKLADERIAQHLREQAAQGARV